MAVNIGYDLDRYHVKLIMVQNKEADTAVYQQEWEIFCEVITDNTTYLIGKGAKTKYICNRLVVRDDVDLFQPYAVCRSIIGSWFIHISGQQRWHHLWHRGGFLQYGLITLCVGFLACACFQEQRYLTKP